MNVVGPVAGNVGDLRLAMSILRGGPYVDRIPRPRGHYRIAWSADFGAVSGHAVRQAIRSSAERLAVAGHHVVELPVDHATVNEAGSLHDALVDVCYRSWYGEGRTPSFDDLLSLFSARDQVTMRFEARIDGFDAWMLPIMPAVAPKHCPKLSDIEVDGELRDYWDVFTADCRPFNVTGQPATAIPIGADANGMPIGVQLIGKRWTDSRLLEVASAIERDLAPSMVAEQR